jgi:hypothetical protein
MAVFGKAARDYDVFMHTKITAITAITEKEPS